MLRCPNWASPITLQGVLDSGNRGFKGVSEASKIGRLYVDII